MKILIEKAKILSPGSAHHLSVKDILIEGEKITSVESPGKISATGATVISGNNLHVSAGWFDLHVNFGEPGFEFKEDVDSGCRAAAQGGFTGVLIMPSTLPPVSSRPAVEYIFSRSKNNIVNVHVAGALSERLEGKELSEMYDMFLAGVTVFTDDKKAIQDSGLMTKALLYSRNFGGRIFAFAEDRFLAGKGVVHEGANALTLGLRGIPSLAEDVMINRDIAIAEYCNAPLHFSTVSGKKSVELIRKAKANGLKVTADVSAMQLLLDDKSLMDFNPVYKVKPPLRSEEDRHALLEGLADGTIDCICSDHIPQNDESKVKEFDLAEFGAAGIETAFAVARTATKDHLSVPELISRFTNHARQCAGLKTMLIEAGLPADLTVFDPDKKWKVERGYLKSKSANNPFLGMELTGKPIAVINNGKTEFAI